LLHFAAALGPFTRNMIFVSRRVVRHRATQLGFDSNFGETPLDMKSIFLVIRHYATQLRLILILASWCRTTPFDTKIMLRVNVSCSGVQHHVKQLGLILNLVSRQIIFCVNVPF
jgi:hypothetical protein